jgi:copper chaperone
MTETKLDVPDMSCVHCKAAVEGSLNALDGVERSNVDLENGVVEVAYDEDRVTAEEIEGAVESAGYTVAS